MENPIKPSRTIHLLDFSPYYPPHIGGMEKYAEELHENLAKNNCRITVFTPRLPESAPAEESKPNIRIIRYPAFDIIFNYPLPRIWKKEFWRQWKRINDSTFDVAVSTLRFFVQPLLALFYAKRHAIPLMHIEHCSDYVKNRFFISLLSRLVDMTMGRFSLSRADAIITPSQSAARFVWRLSKKRSSVIYRGMPFSEIDAIPPDNDLRKKIGNKTTIAFAGRLIYGKGVLHLLEALKLLRRKDVFLFIIGDGPERSLLEEYAKENGLTKQILFLGNIPFEKVISIMKISDIFVNPSYNEGLPTSVLESGACRKAIIATDVGGTVEILTPNRSGIIIEPHSTEAVRNALKKLLDDVSLRKKLGENARAEIEEKFSWDVAVSAYMRKIELLRKKYANIHPVRRA